jgi:hypothetical protein
MPPNNLEEHVFSAYFSLRLGIIVVSFLLPLVLSFGGQLAGVELKPSLSDYYFAEKDWLRDWFVGSLCAVGLFLYAYKGYGNIENAGLNIAGFLGIATALIPCACNDPARQTSLHGAVAVSFFAVMAFVCIWCAPETLGLMRDGPKKEMFRNAYRVIGAAMVVAPLIAYGISGDWKTFFAEAAAIYSFAVYWSVKSWELGITKAERLAVKGQAMKVDSTVVTVEEGAAIVSGTRSPAR